MSFNIIDCPLCGGRNQEQIYVARDRHYGIPGSYPIVRCTGCSLVFLSPMYSDEELSAFYPNDYYAYQSNHRRRQWKELIKRLLFFRLGTLDPKFSAPGRMLDLGCGSGWFLCEMRAKGWEVHGVEISKSAAELGRQTCGLDIFAGTLREAAFPSNYFDYIRANHSFEHISCPGETLDEIHRVLRPGGKLLLGVPNVAGLNARIFRQYWWYLGAPVHPFTYSAATLTQLLRKHCFEIIEVNYNSDFSGVLGSSQIWLNRKSGRKSTEGALIENPILKIFFQWIANGVDLFKLGDAVEIVATRDDG